jgi:hypothetical protein
MIARRVLVVPQFCFAITMTGRDFGSGREEGSMGRIHRSRIEVLHCCLAFFRHGGMDRACVSTVHLHPTCTPPTPRPFIVYPNVRAEYLGQCCKRAKKVEEERKSTELTGIEFTLAGRCCHQHNLVARRLIVNLGCLPRQTHYLLQFHTSFPRWFTVDLNYNTAWDLNNCHPQGTKRIHVRSLGSEVTVPESIRAHYIPTGVTA